MRIAAGLTQAHLAGRLNRPQSFVAKYEGGERRLDVVEFMEVAEAIGFDPAEFIGRLDVSGDAPIDRGTRCPDIDPPKNRTDPPPPPAEAHRPPPERARKPVEREAPERGRRDGGRQR